jgi:hypothetical protein
MNCLNCGNDIVSTSGMCYNCSYGREKIYVNDKVYDITECKICSCGNILYPGCSPCNCKSLKIDYSVTYIYDYNPENKIKIFEYFLNKIQVLCIKEFTKFVLLRLPDYFWTINASQSGKYHGNNETLINHVLSCLKLAECICDEQFKDVWTERQKSQLYSALILHDGWKCGLVGEEQYYAKEDIEKYGPGVVGKIKTTKEHPEIGFKQLLILVAQYNKYADENKIDKIGSKNFEPIAKSVRFHSGPFLKIKDVEFSLSWPFDSVISQTHNIDFIQTKMSMIGRNK